jgi:ABC-2 type transport system permease protein
MSTFSQRWFSLRRVRALCYKESLQILRDPSSNLIAFVLPVMMLFIFGYGINLDSSRVLVGLLCEDTSPEARQFTTSLFGSPYLDILTYSSRQELETAITNSKIRGFVIIPSDFGEKVKNDSYTAPIQVVADGSEPNTAEFVKAFVTGAWQVWQAQWLSDHGLPVVQPISIEPRFWFNPSAESRNYLIPGSITVIMTVIGALLTSLVVAREWERGTMEALLASPVTRTELLLSKIIPYYILGMVSLLICVGVARWPLGVPFRGSLLMLWIVGSFFLLSVLGMGLAISTATRNQFNAAQMSLDTAFLPAMMLSGFVYEVSSMPTPIRLVTYVVPARYFVNAIQTLFQVGDLPSVLVPNIVFLIGSATFFIGLTAKITRRRME